MNFGFTEEQQIFRREVRKFLDTNAPLEEVRKIMESPEGYSPKIMEEHGGYGMVGFVGTRNPWRGRAWVD